ncbi:MAG: hypothetical protein AAB448_01245 [Patescibacteria group bacterium]
MLTLLAQLGTRSLTVDVDPETGVITLPPDTTLENGRWLLSQDGDEIGAFYVTEGAVGTAYSTRRPRVLILDLSAIFSLLDGFFNGQPSTWAERLSDSFDDVEAIVNLAQGKLCPRCGTNHSWTSQESKLQLLEDFVAWAEKDGIPASLQTLIEGEEGALAEQGYNTKDEVRADLLRLQEIIGKITALRASGQSTGTSAPAAEPSGESASQ